VTSPKLTSLSGIPALSRMRPDHNDERSDPGPTIEARMPPPGQPRNNGLSEGATRRRLVPDQLATADPSCHAAHCSTRSGGSAQGRHDEPVPDIKFILSRHRSVLAVPGTGVEVTAQSDQPLFEPLELSER